MKNPLYILIAFILTLSSSCNNKEIDPTGSYELVNETKKVGEDVYGYYGNIDIKMINENKIVISFFICKGAPSYNQGFFIDTLDYKNNQAIYNYEDLEFDCKIIFTFTKYGVDVKQETKNDNNYCGFGYGVIADGYFEKTTSKSPVIKDLARDE